MNSNKGHQTGLCIKQLHIHRPTGHDSLHHARLNPFESSSSGKEQRLVILAKDDNLCIIRTGTMMQLTKLTLNNHISERFRCMVAQHLPGWQRLMNQLSRPSWPSWQSPHEASTAAQLSLANGLDAQQQQQFSNPQKQCTFDNQFPQLLY
jgi:hypothetical protein